MTRIVRAAWARPVSAFPTPRAPQTTYNPPAVARYVPAALVAALLVATALAFVYTEQLKLTKSPILGTRVAPRTISPVCKCPTRSASIVFRLRTRDRVEIDIVRGRDTVVRRLVTRSFPRGRVAVEWDGLDDAAAAVAEGSYRPRVKLARQHRTIVLPNPIRIDTTPPVISLTRLGPRVFSPDGDKRGDRVVALYRVDEPAQVSLLVDGRTAVRKRGSKTAGQIDWFGTVDGQVVRPGVHQLELGARDVAGNAAASTRPRAVIVRYIALGRNRIEATAGSRFAVLVLTDAARIEWKLGARTGTARPGTLKLRAPLQPGRFTLTVTANGHDARAAVIARGPAQ